VKAIIQPSAIRGTIQAPASKSAMQRACALALLHVGDTVINNPGISNDDLAALQIIEHLGARISNLENGDKLISSAGLPIAENGTIHCGESGLSIRMFTPIAALSDQEILITGEGSLLNRPMDFFDTILPQLGVSVRSNQGKLPLRIKGPLQPTDIEINGEQSSQYLTGLLLAFARAAKKQVTITVTNLKSKPYIDLTLQMMQEFGYQVVHKDYQQFIITPVAIQPKTIQCHVEADWSGAANLLVAAAIAGNVTVTGLNVFSAQADKTILQALMQCGVQLSVSENEISVLRPAAFKGKAFQIDATDCPDLFPPLVALAAYCNGISVIEGVGRLAHKESDRAHSLQEGFGKMGVKIELQDDLMLVHGGGPVTGVTVHSHHDHRIAMSCAIAALQASGETSIEAAEAIQKSYPGFFHDLESLGAKLSLSLNS